MAGHVLFYTKAFVMEGVVFAWWKISNSILKNQYGYFACLLIAASLYDS